MIQPLSSYRATNNMIVHKFEKKNVPFNTKIGCSDNCEIVVMTDSSIRRLKVLDEGNINPKKMNLFSRRIDPRTHIIYLIDKFHHDASWGGNVQYEDKKTNGIQEKIFIRAAYSFTIEKGEKFVSLLSDHQSKYSERYVISKINSKLDNAIKSSISQKLNDGSYIETQERIFDCAKEIQTRLNEEILSLYGIEITSLNLVLEEDEEHSAKRNERDWESLEKTKGVN